MLRNTPSPFVIGAAETEILGNPTVVADVFRSHCAVALQDALDPPFLATLQKICDRARFEVDATGDRAARQRERPGTAGGALGLALRRSALLSWLGEATQCTPLRSAYGRVSQLGVDTVPGLQWHDDLAEDPLRRLAITINLGGGAYEGGEFQLRRKTTGEVLVRHRHVSPGSMLIFQVADDLEHCVRPLTAGGPRRVFTGWFVEHESSWL